MGLNGWVWLRLAVDFLCNSISGFIEVQRLIFVFIFLIFRRLVVVRGVNFEDVGWVGAVSRKISLCREDSTAAFMAGILCKFVCERSERSKCLTVICVPCADGVSGNFSANSNLARKLINVDKILMCVCSICIADVITLRRSLTHRVFVQFMCLMCL